MTALTDEQLAEIEARYAELDDGDEHDPTLVAELLVGDFPDLLREVRRLRGEREAAEQSRARLAAMWDEAVRGDVITTAQAEADADKEATRWQERIEEVITRAGVEPFDASGCDSGDPLDWSAKQVEHALEVRSVQHDDLCTAIDVAFAAHGVVHEGAVVQMTAAHWGAIVEARRALGLCARADHAPAAPREAGAEPVADMSKLEAFEDPCTGEPAVPRARPPHPRRWSGAVRRPAMRLRWKRSESSPDVWSLCFGPHPLGVVFVHRGKAIGRVRKTESSSFITAAASGDVEETKRAVFAAVLASMVHAVQTHSLDGTKPRAPRARRKR